MNERIIQMQVYSLFQNYEYKLFNTFMFSWESDFFAISKTGYSVEVEVKISRSDFKADQKKVDKHHLLKHHKHEVIIRTKRPFKPNYHPYYLPGHEYNPDTHPFRNGDASYVSFCCPAKHIPNKFYYAVPEGLIKVEEIPEWAGLIYIRTHNRENSIDFQGNIISMPPSYTYHVVKNAPFLHKIKADFKVSLLGKYYFKHYDIKNDVRSFIRSINHLLNDHQKETAERVIRKFY